MYPHRNKIYVYNYVGLNKRVQEQRVTTTDAGLHWHST